MTGHAAVVSTLVWLGAIGCAADLRLTGDEEDAPATPEDVVAAEEAASPDDAGGEEDAAVPDDGGPPDGPEGCPATIAGPGSLVARIRWRRQVEGVWADPGSAGLAEAQGVVVVGLPTGSAEGGPPQAFRYFHTGTGEPMADPTSGEHDDWFAWCWAMAGARIGEYVHFVGLRWAGGVPVLESTTFDPRDGSAGGSGHLLSELGVSLHRVSDLRAAPAASAPGPAFQTFDVLRGSELGGRGVTFAWLEGEAALAGWELPPGPGGASVRSWAAPGGWMTYELRDDLEVAVSTPTTLALRRLSGAAVASVALRSPSEWTPLTAIDPASDRSDFLLAGRSDDAAAGLGMWVERRRAGDLERVSSVDLSGLDDEVYRPGPRELAGTDDRFALIWATKGGPAGEDGDGCLYATPLDAFGNRTGTSVRLDPEAPAGTPGIEQVRATHDGYSVFVLWRRGADLFLARVDATP